MKKTYIRHKGELYVCVTPTTGYRAIADVYRLKPGVDPFDNENVEIGRYTLSRAAIDEVVLHGTFERLWIVCEPSQLLQTVTGCSEKLLPDKKDPVWALIMLMIWEILINNPENFLHLFSFL